MFLYGLWGILCGCQGVAIVKLFEMFSVYCHAIVLCVVARAMLGGC